MPFPGFVLYFPPWSFDNFNILEYYCDETTQDIKISFKKSTSHDIKYTESAEVY